MSFFLGKKRRSHSPRRRGATGIFFVMGVLIGVAALIVVINWAYMMLAVQRTNQVTSLLARTAVEELLDEQVLRDQMINQGDDIIDAQNVVDAFRIRNNAATHQRLRLAAGDINVVPGYVADVTAPIVAPNFAPAPPMGFPLNTLRIDVVRSAGSGNPVHLLISGFGSPAGGVKVTSAAYAVLDNRVLGLRPRTNDPAPLIPIAIQDTAWFTTRPAGMIDTNVNGRSELTVLLRSNSMVGIPTAALMAVNIAPLNAPGIPSQIQNGILPTDLQGGAQIFGPALPSSPLPVNTSDVSPVAVTDQIVTQLQAISVSSNPRRIFPLYSGPANIPNTNIIGFVGARVLAAQNIGTPADPQLSVTVEPEFIVHTTVETDPTVPDPETNPYVHKLRLVR